MDEAGPKSQVLGIEQARCGQCGSRVVRTGEDGAVQIRSSGPLLFKSSGECVAACHFCKSEISLPLAIRPAPGRRLLVIKKG